MGAFVLGILFGWLLEWLFFTYWVKKDYSTGSSVDCSELKSEVSAKNGEITKLKTELQIARDASITNAAAGSSDKKSSIEDKQELSSKAEKPASKSKPAKKSKVSEKGDDFTKLSGIGPSISSKLEEVGITTFKQLSEVDDDDLRANLEKVGAKLNNNKEVMDSWNEQAALAEKGDFEGLKKLQDSLKS